MIFGRENNTQEKGVTVAECEKKDFFISYQSRDEQQAVTIGEILEKSGYSVILQAWDFLPGMSFTKEMDSALKNSKHLMPIYTKDYFESVFCEYEWTAAFVNYKYNNRAIIPVRIEDVEPPGLLAPIIYIDLCNIEESKWSEELRKRLQPPIRGAGDRQIPSKNSRKGDSVFSVPYSENAYFTGRTDILDLLYANFHEKGITRRLKQMQAIRGLGGIGKTSIALQYAYDNRNDYDTVWWVNADTSNSVLSSYREFLSRKPGQLPEDADDNTVLAEMREWFLDNENWLFVYDNADEEDYNAWLEKYLPQARNKKNGHVLITTRSYSFINCETVDVDVFNEEESVSFLQLRTRKGKFNDTDSEAGKLAVILQHLPLALEQAGAYIRVTPGVNYRDYIDLFNQKGIELMGEHSDVTLFGYTNVVATTWQISMDKITHESSRQLFYMCAYFAPDAIPVDIFIRGSKALPVPLSGDVSERSFRDEILRDLVKYSLVNGDERNESINSDEKRLLSIHRLLQEVVKSILKPEAKWLEHSLELISSVANWNPNTKSTIGSFKTDSPHAVKVAESADKFLSENSEKQKKVKEIFFLLGMMYAQSNNTDMALYCCNKCIEIIERSLLVEDLDIDRFNLFSTHLNRIGVFSAAKDYHKAIEDCNRCIMLWEGLEKKGLDLDESHLATVYMNRGVVHEYLKNHDAALIDKNKSIDIYKRLWREQAS